MTNQRTTNLHSAPMPACLRAFVLAVQTGMPMGSRPESRAYMSGAGFANIGGANGTRRSNGGIGGNNASNSIKRTHSNSVPLGGSA